MVPAFHPDFPVQMIRDGDNGQSGDLRERQNSVLYDVTRPSRAVGRYCDVIAAFNHRHQFEQRLRPAPTGRAANRFHAEASKDCGEERAVPAGTDESRQSPGLVMAASQDGMQFHGEGQAIVPRGIDDLPDVRARHKSVRIVDTAADRCGNCLDSDPDHIGPEALMPLRAVWDNLPALAGDGSSAGTERILRLGHTDNLFALSLTLGTDNAKRIVQKNGGAGGLHRGHWGECGMRIAEFNRAKNGHR